MKVSLKKGSGTAGMLGNKQVKTLDVTVDFEEDEIAILKRTKYIDQNLVEFPTAKGDEIITAREFIKNGKLTFRHPSVIEQDETYEAFKEALQALGVFLQAEKAGEVAEDEEETLEF